MCEVKKEKNGMSIMRGEREEEKKRKEKKKKRKRKN